jgi:ribonuclease P protein component
MFGVASASTDSELGCGPEPGDPSSSIAVRRAVVVSPPDDRRIASLRGHASFRRVYREGRRVTIGGITVVSASGAAEGPRIGVVAGKAVGGAVERNRAKRRLRAALRRVGRVPDADAVVIASPRVNAASFAELVGWLDEAFGRTGEGT